MIHVHAHSQSISEEKNDSYSSSPQSIERLLQNLENGVDTELESIVTRLQTLIQQPKPEKETLVQAEQRLIVLSQLSLIIKSLSMLLLPKTPESQARYKALLEEINKLEIQVKNSIQQQNVDQVTEQFQKQVQQAEQRFKDQEQAVQKLILKREQEIAQTIQNSFKIKG